jgi:hypothetical protein
MIGALCFPSRRANTAARIVSSFVAALSDREPKST